MKNKIEECFLDWCSNWITVDGYASYYGIEVDRAKRLLSLGRKIHYRKHSLCYPCGSKGYHLEIVWETDGTPNRTKVPCACCNGSGKVVAK